MKLPFTLSRLPNQNTLPTANRWVYIALAGVLLVVIIAAISLWGNGAAARPTESTLFAGEGASDQAVSTPAAGNDLWSSIWPLIAMILVLGALYGSLFILRRFTNNGQVAGKTQPMVSLQTSVRIGNNQTLHVVHFGDRQLLVGASQAGLVVLDKASMPESEETEPEFDNYFQDVMSEETQE